MSFSCKEISTIADIQKNEKEFIRIRHLLVNETPMIDIRVYFKNQSGEYFASKKGVCLSPFVGLRVFTELANALKRVGTDIEDAETPAPPDYEPARMVHDGPGAPVEAIYADREPEDTGAVESEYV